MKKPNPGATKALASQAADNQVLADHCTQATLFYESQTAVENAPIAGGFHFELSQLTVPAVRERRVASLVKVSTKLAATVAAGLDGGILLIDGDNPEATASAFIKAVGQHRHAERETAPLRV